MVLWQADLCEYEAILVSTVSSKPARVTSKTLSYIFYMIRYI